MAFIRENYIKMDDLIKCGVYGNAFIATNKISHDVIQKGKKCPKKFYRIFEHLNYFFVL